MRKADPNKILHYPLNNFSFVFTLSNGIIKIVSGEYE